MARLAYMASAGSTLSDTTAGAQVSTCQGRASTAQSRFRWSNGQVGQLGSNWYYANGQPARFGSAWNYPNGQAATFGSSWNYPNGQAARFGPYWYSPTGRTYTEDELLAWACGELGASQCNRRLEAVRGASSFWYELTLVELAWLAYDR